MNGFRKQLEAIGSALLIIERLPEGTVWALEVTNDDDAESPTVLNIFEDEDNWVDLATTLKLGRPVDRSTSEFGEQFIAYRQGTLYISLIDQEEKKS